MRGYGERKRNDRLQSEIRGYREMRGYRER